MKKLTNDCKQVHNCVAWHLLVNKQCWGEKKILPEQNKGFPQGEQRQREDSRKEEGDGRQAKGLTSWGQ